MKRRPVQNRGRSRGLFLGCPGAVRLALAYTGGPVWEGRFSSSETDCRGVPGREFRTRLVAIPSGAGQHARSYHAKGVKGPLAVKMLLLFASVAFFLNIAGCESAPPPGPLPPKSRVAKKPTESAKAAEKTELEKNEGPMYVYNPAGKPDPFKPFIQLTPVRESTRNVPLTPLQKYEISQLKLVAILSTPEERIALVEDAAGKGYFIKKGTEIGQNEGRVTRILKDRVIVEERYQDIFGQTKTNEVSIMLHRPEEGGES